MEKAIAEKENIADLKLLISFLLEIQKLQTVLNGGSNLLALEQSLHNLSNLLRSLGLELSDEDRQEMNDLLVKNAVPVDSVAKIIDCL